MCVKYTPLLRMLAKASFSQLDYEVRLLKD